MIPSRAHHLSLPPEGAHILVALSGGADSVALALMLRDAGRHIAALHCNFHLRGEESDRDECFVRDFCARHDIALYTTSFDTTAHARATKQSIEMAARELRYAWFEEMRVQLGADFIAVAHHRDDNAETVVLNLVRGAGVRGLGGIAPQNGPVLRPLLGMAREGIVAYLEARGESWVTDSTNTDTAFRRNKVRHEVLPLLQELNPAVHATLADTARRLRDAQALVDYAVGTLRQQFVVEEFSDGFDVDIAALLRLPAPETLLYETLAPCGFTASHCRDIFLALGSASVGAAYISDGWTAVVGRGRLEVMRTEVKMDDVPLHEGENLLPDGTLIVLDRLTREQLGSIPRDRNTACLDDGKISEPLTVRAARTGDRFVPLGMRGSKLVSDHLADSKATARRRCRAKVVCCGKTIAWLVGERLSQAYAITEHTQSVLMIALQPKS